MPWWLVFAILLLSALPAALSFALATHRARRQRRIEAAASEPLPSDVCLACGSHEVATIAPEVVRCTTCGFVGGEGMAAWQRRRQAEAYALLAPAERSARAKELLVTARIHLENAAALVERALTHSRLDMAGLSLDRGREKQGLWAEAEAEMNSAHALATDAAALMGASAPDRDAAPAFSSLLVALDASWMGDSFGVDAAVHERIKSTRAALEGLLHAVEGHLATLTSHTR